MAIEKLIEGFVFIIVCFVAIAYPDQASSLMVGVLLGGIVVAIIDKIFKGRGK